MKHNIIRFALAVAVLLLAGLDSTPVSAQQPNLRITKDIQWENIETPVTLSAEVRNVENIYERIKSAMYAKPILKWLAADVKVVFTIKLMKENYFLFFQTPKQVNKLVFTRWLTAEFGPGLSVLNKKFVLHEINSEGKESAEDYSAGEFSDINEPLGDMLKVSNVDLGTISEEGKYWAEIELVTTGMYASKTPVKGKINPVKFSEEDVAKTRLSVRILDQDRNQKLDLRQRDSRGNPKSVVIRYNLNVPNNQRARVSIRIEKDNRPIKTIESRTSHATGEYDFDWAGTTNNASLVKEDGNYQALVDTYLGGFDLFGQQILAQQVSSSTGIRVSGAEEESDIVREQPTKPPTSIQRTPTRIAGNPQPSATNTLRAGSTSTRAPTRRPESTDTPESEPTATPRSTTARTPTSTRTSIPTSVPTTAPSATRQPTQLPPTITRTPTQIPQPVSNGCNFAADFSSGSLSGMSMVGGSWTVENGQLRGVGDSGLIFIDATRGCRDYTVEFDARLSSPNWGFGVFVRVQDPPRNTSRSYACQYDIPTGGVIFNNAWPADNQKKSSVSVPLDTNWHRMKVVVQGSNIQCYLDGALAFNENDSNLSTGGVMLRTWLQLPVYFDNLQVR